MVSSRPRLTATSLESGLPPGKYNDRAGLYLQVSKSGERSWGQRLTVRGRARRLRLGVYPVLTLEEARAVAVENLRLVESGGDPSAPPLPHVPPTFAEAAVRAFVCRRPCFTSRRHSVNWLRPLELHVFPTLGSRRVSDIHSRDILAVLVPLSGRAPATATRLRQRIAVVMGWAIGAGYRTDNPGDLAPLPRPRADHVPYRSLPYTAVAGAVATLRRSDAYAATKLAFEFLVLTATRSQQVRCAGWDEMDLEAGTWTVPRQRIRTRGAFRVPLSVRAREILAEARRLPSTGGLVFPSLAGRMLSRSALSSLLRRHSIGAVPHGFRWSFCDWCETHGVALDVVKACLAHHLPWFDFVDGPRPDLYVSRVLIMEDWGRYLAESS